MTNSNINVKISAKDNASVNINNVGSTLSKLRQNVDLLAHSLQSLSLGKDLAKYFVEFATAGISANAQIESLTTKLTGLISANSANVTSTGQVISAQEKWAKS